MRLHKARIADSVIGRANTDITPGLLHDDAEDSADVNTRLGRYGFDRLLDVGDLVVAVVEFYEAGVGLPEGGIGCPLVLVREVGGRAGILHVVSAAVGASSETGNLASAGLVCGCTWQLYDKADPGDSRVQHRDSRLGERRGLSNDLPRWRSGCHLVGWCSYS